MYFPTCREAAETAALTDLEMPGAITGREVAERLRAVNPNLKVIFTSGYSPGIAGQDLSVPTGPYFLAKPYSIDRLVLFVREVLDQPVVPAAPEPPAPPATGAKACPPAEAPA